MGYTPVEILDYVIDNEKEADFMVSMTMHKYGYSIGEITDVIFKWKDDHLKMISKAYKLNQIIDDPDIVIAAQAGKYISSFISRYNDAYQIHFLVHDCMKEDKEKYDDEITKRVIQYMIFKTIKQLRLDTPEKVDSYLKN